MKHILALLLSLFISLSAAGGTMQKESVYNLSFQKIDESGPINLSDYKDKVILVVNTASLCGFTKQYAELQTLYETYKDKGLVIIAVPSNDFGKQEPGSGAEIKSFCETNFNITFPITSKVDVEGKNSHPFFSLTRKEFGFLSGPKWNFYKYLIGKDGKLITWFSSFTKPMSKKMTHIIEENL